MGSRKIGDVVYDRFNLEKHIIKSIDDSYSGCWIKTKSGESFQSMDLFSSWQDAVRLGERFCIMNLQSASDAVTHAHKKLRNFYEQEAKNKLKYGNKK